MLEQLCRNIKKKYEWKIFQIITIGGCLERLLLQLGVKQILHSIIVQMFEEHFGLQQTVNIVKQMLWLVV